MLIYARYVLIYLYKHYSAILHDWVTFLNKSADLSTPFSHVLHAIFK